MTLDTLLNLPKSNFSPGISVSDTVYSIHIIILLVFLILITKLLRIRGESTLVPLRTSFGRILCLRMPIFLETRACFKPSIEVYVEQKSINIELLGFARFNEAFSNVMRFEFWSLILGPQSSTLQHDQAFGALICLAFQQQNVIISPHVGFHFFKISKWFIFLSCP
jgi:hypothetical protein